VLFCQFSRGGSYLSALTTSPVKTVNWMSLFRHW
jgi:hypothetical protein